MYMATGKYVKIKGVTLTTIREKLTQRNKTN